MFRDSSPPSGNSKNFRHKTKQRTLNQTTSDAVSSQTSAAEQSDAVDVTQLSRRAVNAKNALMRIEAKTKNGTSQGSSHDPAVCERTVFVGNVALKVKKKARSLSCF